MFDSIITGQPRTTRREFAPLAISWTVHVLVIGAVVLLPLLVAPSQLPAVPNELLTYVTVAAAPPPPPPPPPPPAAPQATPAVKRASPRPVPQAFVVAARELPSPVEIADDVESASDFDSEDGVAGGVPGGVPGGVLGGIVGGIADPTSPPPPPPPPVTRAPVRTGGQMQAPALLKRVPPVYPPIAVSGKVQGLVILEATVGRDGRVEDVKVLRSMAVLDQAAIDAVRQWVYAPLLLNGQAERFILTVTVSFSLS
jgi:protein TonB